MTREEFKTPFHVTAGYVGEPGDRTFYLQVEDDDARRTFLAEKGQVQGLGELLTELLVRLEDEPATDWDRDAMGLREPVEPDWRVGELSVGVDPDSDQIVVELSELVPEDAEEGEQVRIWLDRDQARRLAAHAEEVVGQGRPRCRFCGRPEQPDGHVCPAMNGHGDLSR